MILKKSLSEFGVFNPRVLLGSALCLAGALLAALSFGASTAVTTATATGDGNWITVSSPNATSQQLASIACASASDCWAVGSYVKTAEEEFSRTLIERWNGSTWSIVPSPNVTATINNYLESVTCVSASDCWAVGSVDGPEYSALIEHWDGTSWSIAASPHTASQYYFVDSIACTSASNCWAVGKSLDFNSYTYAPLIERWDGTSWTLMSSSLPGPIQGVTCSSATNCWALGNGFAHWDGNSWSVVAMPDAGPEGRLNGMTCTPAGECWAVGENHDTSTNTYSSLIEHWDGTSWSIVPSPSSGPARSVLEKVTCVSTTDCWAAGYVYTAENVSKTLLQRWDGTSWSIATSPNYENGSDNSLRGVACTSALTCWAVGTNRGGHILIEKWNDASWLLATAPDAAGGGLYSQFSDVSCTSLTDCWAVGNIVAHWDGSSWSMKPFPEGSYLSSVSCLSASNCWAAGQSYADYKSHTLIEHWDGTSWSVVNSPIGDSAHDNKLRNITCISASSCWALGQTYDENGSILPSPFIEHWDGSSWSIVSSPTVTQTYALNGVTCASASDCWAVGSSSAGGVDSTLIEHWDGNSWVIFPSPNDTNSSSLSSVTCTSSLDCWAVGSVFEHWDRTSWTITPSQSRAAFSDVACTSSSNCWAISNYVAQHWDGNAWTIGESETATYPLSFDPVLQAVTCPAESRCWAVGYAWYRDEVYYSVDARTLIQRFYPKPPLTSTVSRMTHGSTGTFDLNLALSGTPTVECRRGGADSNYTIVFTFADSLTSVDDLFAYTIAQPSNEGVPNSGAIGTDPHQYIVTLSGVPNGKHLYVDLRHVHDAAGNVGNFSQPIDVLVGDVNANRTVSNADVASIQAQVGATVTQSNFRNDVNANGTLSNGDVAAAQAQVGTQLPP